MSTITLSCLVEENTQSFANVDVKDIKLWKVDISLEEENEKLDLVNTKINVNIKEELGSVELLPLSKISKYFHSQPADEHIHIIVQRPVETKEVHCMGSRLRTCFTFPDGTEDKHIVINRERGSEKEIICLVDDEDLATQQPFSSWTFPQIKTLFGLTADSYIDLPRFDGGLANTTNYKKILGHVLDMVMKHKTCIHVTSANEATRREFISSVLHGVASCYDGEVKVCPEYELSGSHGKGPVRFKWVAKLPLFGKVKS
ncbi:hypothetical protein RhiirA1_467719 [Rhizophagus irregularis]|uniref:Crinkler effector protein N-terminal domain-containing protein n=1 Tax=Rhizophagus irregularis TaxID=588596 RepID=A0A2N0RBJ5_9GLOM|nr:hypothetical protein RhiirA1_467719 [Rhizophagus irregularis]